MSAERYKGTDFEVTFNHWMTAREALECISILETAWTKNKSGKEFIQWLKEDIDNHTLGNDDTPVFLKISEIRGIELGYIEYSDSSPRNNSNNVIRTFGPMYEQ